MKSTVEELMPAVYWNLVAQLLGTPEMNPGLAVRAPSSPSITVQQQLGQVRSLNASELPGWALRVGASFDAAAHGALGTAALAAPTLEHALNTVERYGHLRSPYFRFSSRIAENRYTLLIAHHEGIVADELVALLESTTVSLTKLIDQVAGTPIEHVRVNFPYAQPLHHNSYKKYLRAHVTFGTDVASISIPDVYLARLSPFADPTLEAAAINVLCRDAIAFATSDDGNHVRHILRLQPGPETSLGAVAATINVSTRTLGRRLRDTGTTFQELRDEARRSQAHHLLTTTDLKVEQISHRLGYSDSANFGRACRRWFGRSPGNYRADHAHA
jgi:AraC-like DNA-binding protein